MSLHCWLSLQLLAHGVSFSCVLSITVNTLFSLENHLWNFFEAGMKREFTFASVRCLGTLLVLGNFKLN